MNDARPVPRVWVLPNRNTIGFVAVLFAMWYAGASQSNAAAYLLCFMLVSMAAVSTVHSWANLRGLHFQADVIRPVFAGEELVVPLTAKTDQQRSHFAVTVASLAGGTPALFDQIAAGTAHRGELHVSNEHRGFHERLPVRVRSRYPVGFFTAAATHELPQSYFVYPRPDGDAPLPRAALSATFQREGLRVEGDDFGGARTWQPGESQRHIDWKAAARGQPLLTKQWAGDADEIAYLQWEGLGALDEEARLSQLTRWVVTAESLGLTYSLRLPEMDIPLGRGEVHYHHCLQALATWPARPPGAPATSQNGHRASPAA